MVYTQAPAPYIPLLKPRKGRKKGSYVSDLEPVKAKDLDEQITDFQWKTYTIRQGTKGPIIRKVVVLEVYM